MKWQCGLEQVSVAAVSSTRRDTELQIWDILLQNHRGTHKVRIPIKCFSVSSELRCHVSCIVAIPRLRKQDVPFVCEGSSIMSKPTLFVTILNSCGLNQSSSPLSKWNRQHRRSRLLYTTLVYFPIVWTLSFSLLVSFGFCYSSLLYSNVKFEAHLLSLLFPSLPPSPDPRQLSSRSAGLNSWPEVGAVDFLNKVSFNET